MAAKLAFIAMVLSALLGAALAIFLVRVVVERFGESARASALVGARVGEVGMLVPSMLFSLFLGAPLSGGFAIGAVGESAAQLGFALGYAASFFGGLLAGGLAGAVLGVAVQRIRNASSAS